VRLPVILSGIAIVTASTVIASSAEAQSVRRTGGGNLNVEFPGPCTVHYDGYGRYRYADSACNRQQRYVADRVMSDYLRSTAPGFGGGFGSAKYRITDIRYDRVRFADDCRIYFDRLGRQISEKNGCNSQQRSIASREIGRWRQQNGFYPGGGGWYPGGNWNDLNITPTYDGGLHVRFRDKCDIYYNRYGYRIRSEDKCSRYQKQRADEAVRYYSHGVRY